MRSLHAAFVLCMQHSFFACRIPHLLFYRQRFIYWGESEAFAKHTPYAHTKYAHSEYAKHPLKHAFFACRSIRSPV
jgi:hypothetical protein